MRSKPKVGDVFEVSMGPSTRRFFQFIASDATQLHSHVVRVFREAYSRDESIDLEQVALGEIDFHTHVLLPIGVKSGFWKKAGTAKAPEEIDVLFRSSNDYGDPNITSSRDWYVWKLNRGSRHVGVLRPEHQSAEIGVVVPPDSVIYRMRNGTYDFFYPAF